MRIHFIAVGGSIMHNLAIALKKKGHTVTGSDDEIFDPAKTRLDLYGILPKEFGWHPELISADIEAVITGMHARQDNPELLRAQELGLPIYSFPEFVAKEAEGKTQIVVTGSHGKTTITSMIMHVLSRAGMDFDYLVGAPVAGFDDSVRLSKEARVMIIEGDEYLTSPLDPRPKFLLYDPTVCILSGIAWDHYNVFPTYEKYLDQFRQLLDKLEAKCTLIYNIEDEEVLKLVEQHKGPYQRQPYATPDYEVREGITWLNTPEGEVPLKIIGRHNLSNMESAHLACRQVNVDEKEFYDAIRSFAGAGKRMELMTGSADKVFYRDFAHAPSKVKATVGAVKEQYPQRELVACLELHTYSSLSKEFLPEYNGAFDAADVAYIFINPEAVKLKRLEEVSEQELREAFSRDDIKLFTTKEELQNALQEIDWDHKNLLLMTSGNFSGLDMEVLKKEFEEEPEAESPNELLE